jgi:hypothetical protein
LSFPSLKLILCFLIIIMSSNKIILNKSIYIRILPTIGGYIILLILLQIYSILLRMHLTKKPVPA